MSPAFINYSYQHGFFFIIVKRILTFVLIIRASLAMGQSASEHSTFAPLISPPSPNAAALEKYVSTPVSGYTGIPNIGVELYKIQERDLSIPISLSYHAGGFRVAEEASWVGLGWTLNAGGIISRTIRDVDDFAGWLKPDNPPLLDPICAVPDISPDNFGGPDNAFCVGDSYTGAFAYQSLTSSTGYAKSNTTALPILYTEYDWHKYDMDWEPDNFTYSFPNHSGQFVFDEHRAIAFVQKEKLLLEYAVTNYGNTITWKATAADGFQYFFEAAGRSYTNGIIMLGSGISEWYLTKMRSPQGEEATFVYEDGAHEVFSQPSLSQFETKRRQGPSGAESLTGTSYSSSRFDLKYLARINFTSGYIVFERSSTPRLDLEGAEALHAIKVYSKSGNLLKTFTLNTSYFESPPELSPYTYTPSTQPNTYNFKRLRLDQVQEEGTSGTIKPPTIFTYNATALPAKTSYDIDYWGYYNGAKYNTSLIPTYAGPVYGGDYDVFKGANREPDAAGMQAAVLQKITYPTGGSTIFSFEPNRYVNLTDEERYSSAPEGSYSSAATKVVSVMRDDYYPDYNLPPQTFTLTNHIGSGDGATQVHVNVLFIDNIPGDWDGKSLTNIILTGPNGYTRRWGFISADLYDTNVTQRQVDEYVSLLPGTYQLTASTPGKSLQSYNTTSGQAQIKIQGALIWFQYQEQTDEQEQPSKMAGGLRVAKIVDSDGLNMAHNQIRLYEYPASGVLLTHPRFVRLVKTFTEAGENFNTQFQLCSFSNAYLSSGAQGSIVGYGKVITYIDGLKQSGKVEQTFYSEAEREPTYFERSPSVPTRRNILNGLLKQEDIYTQVDKIFHLVKSVTTVYDSVQLKDISAIFRGSIHQNSAFGELPTPYQEMYYYPIATGWVRPVTTTSRIYGPTSSFTQTTSYRYDERAAGHMQVTTQQTQRSDGSTLLTHLTYPADYTSVTTGPLAAMRSDALFQHNAVVESTTQVYGPNESPAQAKIIAGTYTEYTQPTSTSKYLPAVQRALELTAPTSTQVLTVPALPAQNLYAERGRYQYDPVSANLQQTKKLHDVPISYLWGYQNTRLIAVIRNASYRKVQQHLQTLGITLSTLTTDEQLRAALSQLRKSLPQAELTSYTYAPLVGITSQTDPTGRTTTYEYDSLGRLVRTRDEQGRILSQQQYHYAGTK